MDAVLLALGQKLPELGVTGALVFVLILLVRRESSTEERHAAQLKRLNASHDEELKRLRADRDREHTARRAAEKERDQRRRGP